MQRFFKMLRRVLFSFFIISSTLMITSCEEEKAIEHRKFNLDVDDYMHFPVGSNWRYIKHHEDPDSLEYEYIELLEIKEKYMPSQYGDYMVMERENIFWSEHDSTTYSLITKEVEVTVEGEKQVVFETRGDNFLYYGDIDIPGYRFPESVSSIEMHPEIPDSQLINNHYQFINYVNISQVALLSPDLLDIVPQANLITYMGSLAGQIQGIPVIRQTVNGIVYTWNGSDIVPEGKTKEFFLARNIGPLIKADYNKRDVWILTSFNIPNL